MIYDGTACWSRENGNGIVALVESIELPAVQEP